MKKSNGGAASPSRLRNTGKQFEKAVAQFVKALAPDAEVIQNYFGRDKDTGERQQMDVVVRTRLARHLPITVLVSCKDYRRILHAGDIRTFCQELTDSGATAGVIYSSRGFNANALKKACAHGINCCRLFQDQPSELPESLCIASYLSRAIVNCPAVVDPSGRFDDRNWDDFLRETVIVHGIERVVIDVLEELYREGQRQSARSIMPGKVFPEPWRCDLDVLDPVTDVVVTLVATGSWQRFRGRKEAHLVNGSYCMTGETFAGQQALPPIAAWEDSPGHGWEETTDDPAPGWAAITACQFDPPLREAMIKQLRGKRLREFSPVVQQVDSAADQIR